MHVYMQCYVDKAIQCKTGGFQGEEINRETEIEAICVSICEQIQRGYFVLKILLIEGISVTL